MGQEGGWGSSRFHTLTIPLALVNHLRALNLASVPYLPKVRSHSTCWGPSPMRPHTIGGCPPQPRFSLLRPAPQPRPAQPHPFSSPRQWTEPALSPQVLPVLFSVLASADVALREDIFTQLTKLVAFVKQHIRRFLPEMLQVWEGT